MTTTNKTLAAHATCHLTGIDCTVPHCRACDGHGYLCDGDCGGTGQARCECGALAVRTVDGEAVCERCPEEVAPPPADPGRTKRIPVESMSALVWGSR